MHKIFKRYASDQALTGIFSTLKPTGSKEDFHEMLVRDVLGAIAL